MNAAVNNSGSNGTKPILGVLIFILFIVGLYYLYNFLYGKNVSYGQVSILGNAVPTTKTFNLPSSSTVTNNVIAATDITGILDGGQYSVSFWVYVADTKGFAKTGSTPLAHLLEISDNRFANTDKGKTLIYVGLNPINATLVVRQSTSDPSSMIDNNLMNVTGGSYSTNSLITSYNSGSTFTSDDRCDILNGIEYQRWILVSVVANGRTLDVYIDGKLARSCVYKSNFALGSTTGKATAYFGLNNNGHLKGYMSSGTYYNYALTPDAVWSLYQAGPTGYFTIGSFFSNLFNIDVSFGTTAGMDTTSK
jgi:hypothetical protein